MKYLVAFGCSHTNGSMLDGKNSASEYNVRNGFPAILAKRHGYELINISKPGGSNQHIFRTVLDFVNNHMEDQYDYLFLINWSGANRIELRYPEKNDLHNYVHYGDHLDFKSVPFTVGIKPSIYTYKPIVHLIKYIPYLFDDNMMFDKWATYAYSLQCILKKNNIRYLMSNTCEGLKSTEYNANVINKLDTLHYPHISSEKDAMVTWLLNQGVKKTPCWHFREDGHALWADRLETYLKELGYVE